MPGCPASPPGRRPPGVGRQPSGPIRLAQPCAVPVTYLCPSKSLGTPRIDPAGADDGGVDSGRAKRLPRSEWKPSSVVLNGSGGGQATIYSDEDKYHEWKCR